jgi:NADH-quinone oxidoreductase subunit J
MIGTILFIVLAVIAVLAAIGMLMSTNAVHAALFLVVNFSAIALFYLGLNAPFLAMVQITVYAGAIMVLFLFVIMLLGAEQVTLASKLRWQIPIAAVLTTALIGVTAFILFSPAAGVNLPSINPADAAPSAGAAVPPGEDAAAASLDEAAYGSPRSVGTALFSAYLLPFELTGVLLLAAMVGAVVLAREERRDVKRSRRMEEAADREPRVLSGD